MRKYAFIPLVALSLVLTGGLGAAVAQTTPADRQLFQEAARQVRQYANYTVFDDVSLSVDQGVVTLHGKVTMPSKRDAIEERVAGVEGVASVDNRIEVLPVSQYDDWLRYQAAWRIYGDPDFTQLAAMANPPIHIIVENGRVTLTGVVRSEVDRLQATALTASIGALSVTNDLKTDAEVDSLLNPIT